MIVSQSLVKTYPLIAGWICNRLPNVKKNTKVFKAFQRYAGFDEKVAERALVHGNLPNIEYRNIPTANGEFNPKYPDTVFLAMAVCKRFVDFSDDSRMHVLVESTLLHEMVHWGNAIAKRTEPQEMGKAFEREAYGQDIRACWP